MRILLIRHGESEADILNVHEGRADFSLTSKGREQAKAMAAWIHSNYQLNKIYSSTLKRARETAEYLANEFHQGMIEDELLMEFNNGDIAGLSREEASVRFPEIKNLPIHEAVYHQESKLYFRYRADVMLSKLLSSHQEDETIAVVTHGGMINQLYHSFLRLPVESSIAFPTGDTGIHEWRVTNERRIVYYANRCEHLINSAE